MMNCCRKIILRGLLILSIAAFATSTDSVLCDDFYNNAIETIYSISYDSIRLSVFRTPPPQHHLSFKETEKVCRLCLDGSVVQSHNSIRYIQYLPTWIGAVNTRPKSTSALRDNWDWLDGTKLDDWAKGFPASVFYPTSLHFDSESSYAFYVFPNNWIGNDESFLDTLRNDTQIIIETEQKISNRTDMKWIALKQETELELSMFPISSGYEPQLTLEEEIKLTYSMNYIVCQRPYRPICHYWNYTEQCRMDSKFGCHTYINIMYHNSDDASVQCRPPEYRRIAQRCPISNCTCQVTQWDAWSACGEKFCSAGEHAKRRYRSEVDSACPPSHIHPALVEAQVCQIPGCDSLLLADD